MGKIHILLADDHNVLRQGIAQVLDMQPDMKVVAQAQNGEEAVQLAQKHQPAVALLDINMPALDGVAATRQLRKVSPDTRIIILTMYRTHRYIFDAIKAGAMGYILKEAEMEELLAAVRAVARNEAVLDPSIADKVLEEFRAPDPDVPPEPAPQLSTRDTEILKLLGQGRTNQDIAARLEVAEKTIRNRLSLIFRQLHLKNRTEAALYAVKKGLSRPEDS